MNNLSRLGAFTLLALASTTIMVGCVIVPGLAQIAAHTGLAEHAGWLVTIPSLGVIVFGPYAGKLILAVGSRRALCFGLFAYGVLGMGGQMLVGAELMVSRLLLGGATAVIMSAGTGLISQFYAGAERLQMMAKQGMAIELGGVIFLFIGGMLATLGWRWPFLLYAIGWVFMLMVMFFVPEPPSEVEAGAKDSAGARLPAALNLVYLAAMFSMIFFFITIIKLPIRLTAMRLNEAQIGYFLSFLSLMAVAAAGILPLVVARCGERLTLVVAFICYGMAHAAFAVSTSLWHLGAGAIAAGIGFGLSIPLVNSMIVDRTRSAERARALAYLSMAIFGGQFLSSFAELLPGDATQIFTVSCATSLLCGMLLFSQRAQFAATPPGRTSSVHES